MRKKNAFRKRSSKTSGKTSAVENVADITSQRKDKKSEDILSRLADSGSSSDDDTDYIRSRRKLRRSVDTTNRRLENIANRMATAIDKATETSESSEESDKEDSNKVFNHPDT